MDKKEKIYLIQCLLEDVRGNWADPIKSRVWKAKELCKELGEEFLDLANSCDYFIKYFDNGECLDGRFFRKDFPYGYIGMDDLHGLSHTLNDKSDEFKKYVDKLITYPEYRFKDQRDW